MAEQKQRRMSPVHPSLAAAWKDTFLDQKALEVQHIEGIEIEYDLARDLVEYIANSYGQLLKDINGDP